MIIIPTAVHEELLALDQFEIDPTMFLLLSGDRA
jgi:hypothetical protein